jgi:hypothetical protein
MSKKSAPRRVPAKAASTTQARPQAPAPPIDRLANWLARRSRATRLAIAGLIAVGLTGVTALLLYGFLIALPPGSLNIGQTTPSTYLMVTLILVVIVGFVYYWIGWRVLIGFDFGDTPLTPGRPAALWVMFSLAVLVFTLCLIALYTLSAIAPT